MMSTDESFFEQHEQEMVNSVAGLSSTALLLMCSAPNLARTVLLLELNKRLEDPDERVILKPLLLEIFFAGANASFRWRIWSALADGALSAAELTRIILAVDRSAEHYHRRIKEEAFKELLERADIESSLADIVANSMRNLRCQAFEQLLQRNPDKGCLIRCMRTSYQVLAERAFDLLLERFLEELTREDVAAIGEFPGYAVWARKQLKGMP